MSQAGENLCYSNLATGMARAVLAEVADRLGELARSGATAVIDLRSLPLTDADLSELEELLGQGEVTAEIEVIGTTQIRETAFAGVWWVRHLGSRQKVAAEEIAITPMPDILKAQAEDIEMAAGQIRRQIQDVAPAGADQEASHG